MGKIGRTGKICIFLLIFIKRQYKIKQKIEESKKMEEQKKIKKNHWTQTNVDNATKKISHDIYGKTRQAPIHLKLDDFSVFINDKNITIILQNEKTIENVK